MDDHTTEQEVPCSIDMLWEGQTYRVRVYYDPQRRARGAYQAVTILGPGDWLISDGASPARLSANSRRCCRWRFCRGRLGTRHDSVII
jgi:hypothetical protein